MDCMQEYDIVFELQECRLKLRRRNEKQNEKNSKIAKKLNNHLYDDAPR